MRAGLIEIEEAPSEEPHPTFYPVGCCYLCRRAAFLGLGGYDDVFAPFFWEDVDLGYRAWRRGLASVHDPRAVCHHEGSATIGQRPMSERLASLVSQLGPLPPPQRAGPAAPRGQPRGLGRLQRCSTTGRP